MESNFRLPYIFMAWSVLIFFSCESQQRTVISPPHYYLTSPEKFNMPDELREISGIAFNKLKGDTIYAEQDEAGRLFHFKLGDRNWPSTRFAKKGDFEDVTICNGYVIMLRSDGVLYTFPVSETNNIIAGQVQEFSGLLPAGEYEGLASVEAGGKIFVLCKHCETEKTSKWGGGFILSLNTSGSLSFMESFTIDIRELERMTGVKKINFHPSALTRNPDTGDWWILSSVNHVLVVTDETWKIKSVYPLNISLFAQPEGIAFDESKNLYISNERGETAAATILKFAYKN